MDDTRRLLVRSHWSLHGQPGGGADLLMHNIATALAGRDWEVEILCPRPNESAADGPSGESLIQYRTFDYGEPTDPVRKMVNSVRGRSTFRELVRERDYDVLLDDISHIPFYPLHFDCPDGTVNALFMHTAFFNAAWQFQGRLRGTVVNLIDRSLPYLDAEVVCAGPSTATRMEEIAGCDSTHVLNPCIDLDQFEYEFDPDSKRVLFLGRLTARKNASCLLRAWARIEDKYDDYTLTIAGTGNQEQELKRLAADLDLETVEFAGFVDEAEKITLYRDALVFVLPSLMEGYVTTGLEALASGTPVVGADTYGINDYVVDGENGFLFSTDDPAALARALRRAFEHPAGLESMARQGRELAEEHSFSAFQEKADRLFSTLADR